MVRTDPLSYILGTDRGEATPAAPTKDLHDEMFVYTLTLRSLYSFSFIGCLSMCSFITCLVSSFSCLSNLMTPTAVIKHFVSRVIRFLLDEGVGDLVWHWLVAKSQKLNTVFISSFAIVLIIGRGGCWSRKTCPSIKKKWRGGEQDMNNL